jgi:dTDP-4-dehydrorhamnose 3,5-epimerase
MNIEETSLPGVRIIEPKAFADARGWFMETFNAAVFRAAGLPEHFAQDNQSHSVRGVIRGLHYQREQPQGKLVRCIRGSILDVAVDVRRGSETFGKWILVELSEENQRMLWIPPKFAHGFCALTDKADILYKCTTLWDKQSDTTLLWNDPDLAIDWGVSEPIVSEKDQQGYTLRDAPLFDL